MRPDKDEYYLNIACAVSKRSTCIRRHYGCVIVKDDIIIATGYNGSPRGEVNCCDCGECGRKDAKRYTGYENCASVHAEQNALITASYDRLKGATLYLVCEEYMRNEELYELLGQEMYAWAEDEENAPWPCGICMRMIKNAGIKEIINRRGSFNVRD